MKKSNKKNKQKIKQNATPKANTPALDDVSHEDVSEDLHEDLGTQEVEFAENQADLPNDDLTQIVYNDSDDHSVLYGAPNIAKRISTKTGLFSAFLVLIPLLFASTLAFLNQGASPETQDAVAKQLSQNATQVADSVQWQLASSLNTPLNTSTSSVSNSTSGPLLPKLQRELDYKFFDVLYDVAAPLDSSITTSTDPKLQDVLSEIAAPIEAEGGLLYLYDSKMQVVYASRMAVDDVARDGLDLAVDTFADAMLKDFTGEGFTEVTGETAYVARRTLAAADWQMVLYQAAPTASARNIALMRPLALLTLLGPLLALLLGNLWGFFNLQRPLNELRDGVQRLLSGKQTASVPRNRADELGLLTKEVSLLSQKFSAVVLEEAEPKERLFEAQERIRQDYLRENYPEQFDGEDDVNNALPTGESASNTGLSQMQGVSTKEASKKAEADKKAIADLEKALAEARATQNSLTESNATLASQLDELKNSKETLVPKDKLEADLTHLQIQLDKRSKALKGHIRSAKASAMGFKVSDSESNMIAAEKELDSLSDLITSFGENSLGITPVQAEHKAQEKSTGKFIEKSTGKSTQKPTGKSVAKVSESQTSITKRPDRPTSSSQISNRQELGNQAKSVTSTKQTGASSNQGIVSNPAKNVKVHATNSKDLANAETPLTPTSTQINKQNNRSSNTIKVDDSGEKSKTRTSQKVIEKQGMLTPLPNSDVAHNASERPSTAIAAKDIDVTLEPFKETTQSINDTQKDVPQVESKNLVESKDLPVGFKTVPSSSEVSTQEVNVAAINYDAAIALEIDKNPNLLAALEEYLQGFKQHTQIQVEHYVSAVTLSEQNKVLLRDFIKAAFDNIAEHSDASSVLLELNPSKDESTIDLMIVDNGKGFNPDSLAKDSKLEKFKKAFSIINGELMLYSSSSEGTIINASLPL